MPPPPLALSRALLCTCSLSIRHTWHTDLAHKLLLLLLAAHHLLLLLLLLGLPARGTLGRARAKRGETAGEQRGGRKVRDTDGRRRRGLQRTREGPSAFPAAGTRARKEVGNTLGGAMPSQSRRCSRKRTRHTCADARKVRLSGPLRTMRKLRPAAASCNTRQRGPSSHRRLRRGSTRPRPARGRRTGSVPAHADARFTHAPARVPRPSPSRGQA